MNPVNQATDEGMREALLAAFKADRRLRQLDIRVGVLNGIVHLAGRTRTTGQRQLAEELASKQPGVRAVVNRNEAPGAPSPSRTININL